MTRNRNLGMTLYTKPGGLSGFLFGGPAGPPISRCPVREIARLQVCAEVRRVKALAARPPRELRGVPPARLRPDIRVEPFEHGAEIAGGDPRVEVGHAAPYRREPLRRVHGPQRVA